MNTGIIGSVPSSRLKRMSEAQEGDASVTEGKLDSSRILPSCSGGRTLRPGAASPSLRLTEPTDASGSA
ncbi:hypothetical protein LDENG_00034440 [Lucifuga dentata]|nr:hypothetical protein LDENG_00034440 [Lucifuga dentata]